MFCYRAGEERPKLTKRLAARGPSANYLEVRERKKGSYARGLFAGGISRISKISKFSRISGKWSDPPLFSRVWEFSKFSRISRKWTFLKRPLFQKTPFSEPDKCRLRAHLQGRILVEKNYHHNYEGFANDLRNHFLSFQGVFAEKGARFHGKWGLGPPPPNHPAPRPRPPPSPGGGGVGVLLKIPKGGVVFQERGGDQGCARGNFGGGGERRRGPIYRENEPPFRRKRLFP